MDPFTIQQMALLRQQALLAWAEEQDRVPHKPTHGLRAMFRKEPKQKQHLDNVLCE